jgi:predicted nuclease of predicted toxin-antitoxin system
VSRRRAQSQPDPEFFIDRSLGRYQLAGALREIGWTVHTHFEVYGDRDEDVDDVEWVAYAGEHGYVVLMRDTRIRRRAVERQALVDAGVRAFVLTAGQVTAEVYIETVLSHRHRILQRARKRGPTIFAVRASGVEKLRLPP